MLFPLVLILFYGPVSGVAFGAVTIIVFFAAKVFGAIKLAKPFTISYTIAFIFCLEMAALAITLGTPLVTSSVYGEDIHPLPFTFVLTFIAIQSGTIGAASALARCESRRTLFFGGFGAIFALPALLLGSMLFNGENRFTFHHVFTLLLVLFLFILPLFNSLFDWLSWWATRALGRRLLAVLDPAQGFWPRLTAVLGHGLADLAAAVALLLLMAFALGLGFQVYNDLAIMKGGTPPFDLPKMIDAVALHPWTEGFWVTMMLVTTLLPTIGHGVMLLGSPLGLMLIPDSKRLALAEDLDGYAMAGERRPSICRRAARWHVQERTVGWVLGGVLLGWLVARVGLVFPLGLADWAAGAAHAGVRAARYLVGFPSA